MPVFPVNKGYRNFKHYFPNNNSLKCTFNKSFVEVMVKQTRSTHIFLIPYIIASKKSHTLKCRTFALWYFLFSKRQHIHLIVNHLYSMSCCCYHKGRNFQANHNPEEVDSGTMSVVVATTKVGIFKQITTKKYGVDVALQLLLLPQR